MRLTLSEIRARALDWLDDPNSEYWAAARLDRLINEAYADVAREVDRLAVPWAARPESAVLTITTNQTDREYVVPNARRIEQVCDGDTVATRRVLEIIPYADRDRMTRCGVYVFRSGADGEWYVGVESVPSPFATLYVSYHPRFSPLVNPNDVPFEVPDQGHMLIAYQTAFLAKVMSGRDPAAAAARYAQALDQFIRDMGNLQQPYTSRRLGR